MYGGDCPQDSPINPLNGAFEMRIADGRDNPAVGALQESGRIYSCDEFPPASWVEGGVGTPGQNNPEGDGKILITLMYNGLTVSWYRRSRNHLLRANSKKVSYKFD